ncbi:FAD-dependent oxidoreductase [Xanthobacter dioxanivorans]|uniref:FAD-dependent oxidoreductase n=1 Tax=Xanthobacter dioxanivorans TaxID=2528964 RepID=A0A974PUA9_9HYPH|nr:FAD-dependent oxidoreductase [Xanthobacter dioxanivorans]QRG09215.1 FAD-dependent oxidoreductase [Xanthobacter dioxanivorans]
MSAPVVIVGAGQAAAQAVTSLKAEGYAGDIVVLGDEPYLPYQRPPLSKAYLGDEMTEDRLELKAPKFYADAGAQVRTGVRVARIHPAEKRVDLADGSHLTYGALLIATGTRARALPVPGADLPGVFSIRSIDDVKHFRAAALPGARLVIIGGGYIGLEVAAKARKLGLDVSVVEGQERLLARVACATISDFARDLHVGHGVAVLTGMGVTRITGTDRVTGVELADGRILPADLVLSAVGAVPNAELATEAGIALENGIRVDAATRTSAPDIYAAGDVASFPSTLYGRRVRLESVQNAIDQAKSAAKTITGSTVAYDPVPWFWSDQYDVKLQIAGLLDGFDRTECEGDIAAGRFCVRYFAGDRLLAVCSVNDPKSHMLARKALVAPPPLPVPG